MLLLTSCLIASRIWFADDFSSMVADKWVQGDWKGDLSGVWNTTDSSLTTTDDARFYTIATHISPFAPFEGGDTFVLQYSVKLPVNLSCAGAYIKLFPSLEHLNIRGGQDETEYSVMFGPDVCGTNKLHAILRHNNSNVAMKKPLTCEKDDAIHFYTLVIHANASYKILVDGVVRSDGELRDDWPFLPPRQIDDPDQWKPVDWVDDETMVDPKDVEPNDWPPEVVFDPSATQPDDWNEEDDGAWEAPYIPNPEYKPWTVRKIPNPDYKGPWVQPQMDNPEYLDDPDIGKLSTLGAVGFDLWQVTAGSRFDNILLASSIEEATDAREGAFDRIIVPPSGSTTSS